MKAELNNVRREIRIGRARIAADQMFDGRDAPRQHMAEAEIQIRLPRLARRRTGVNALDKTIHFFQRKVLDHVRLKHGGQGNALNRSGVLIEKLLAILRSDHPRFRQDVFPGAKNQIGAGADKRKSIRAAQ